MPFQGEKFMRSLMGSSLQTGALRAILLLGAFAVLGTLLTLAVR